MTNNKQAYKEQGKLDFEAGKERSKRFASRSWQEDAYDSGYNDALRAKAVQDHSGGDNDK